jgi:hypothetical protein
MDQDVYTFRKNTREEIRASLCTFKGHDLLALRVFFAGADGVMRPTQKGITFSRALLPELERAVCALREACGDVNGKDAADVAL